MFDPPNADYNFSFFFDTTSLDSKIKWYLNAPNMPYLKVFSTDTTFQGAYMLQITATENYSGLSDDFYPVIYIQCVTSFTAPSLSL